MFPLAERSRIRGTVSENVANPWNCVLKRPSKCSLCVDSVQIVRFLGHEETKGCGDIAGKWHEDRSAINLPKGLTLLLLRYPYEFSEEPGSKQGMWQHKTGSRNSERRTLHAVLHDERFLVVSTHYNNITVLNYTNTDTGYWRQTLGYAETSKYYAWGW